MRKLQLVRLHTSEPLETIPHLETHLGTFLTNTVYMRLAPPRTDRARVIKTEEKGFDVNLAAYMLLDSFRGDVDTAVVISNDSDLATLVSLVRHELALRYPHNLEHYRLRAEEARRDGTLTERLTSSAPFKVSARARR